jgi:hypothetical protein
MMSLKKKKVLDQPLHPLPERDRAARKIHKSSLPAPSAAQGPIITEFFGK